MALNNEKLNDPDYAALFSKLGVATRAFNRVDRRLNKEQTPPKR